MPALTSFGQTVASYTLVELAYGSTARGRYIRPDNALVFDVKLLEIL